VDTDHSISASFEPIPDIIVDPTTVSFGNVNINSSSQRTITIRNDGYKDLIIGTITEPQLPFSKISDNCSDNTLSSSENCSITISFSPTSLYAFNGTVNIPSNDPDNNPVTLALTGTGTTPETPDITVLPETSLSFPNITVGTYADQTITVKNEGTIDLTVFHINPPSVPFSIPPDADNCSNITLAPDQSCTIDVRFSPSTSGTFNSNFGISSDDPDENPVNIQLIGSATPSTNEAPTKPALKSPVNGSENQPTTTTLRWGASDDPDGDTVTYNVFIGTEPSFSGSEFTQLASSQTASYAVMFGLPQLIIALFLTFSIGMLVAIRKDLRIFLVVVTIIAGLLMSSCGVIKTKGDDNFATSQEYHKVSNLQHSTTYYWKVVADDGNGGQSESDLYTFTTTDPS
jgi:hypothetical protein